MLSRFAVIATFVFLMTMTFSANLAYGQQYPRREMPIERFIPFGSTLNVFDIAIDPNSERLFFTDVDNNSLVIIDLKENRTTSVELGAYPDRIAVNSVTSKVYVTHECNCPVGYAVSVVDFSKDVDSPKVTNIENSSVPAARIALNEKTNRVYVTSGTNSITVIDGSTDKIMATIQANAFEIDVNYNTNTIYAIDGNKTLYKIDGLTNSVVANVTVDKLPIDEMSPDRDNRLVALAVNPNTNVVYLINQIIPLKDPGELAIPQALLVTVNGTSSSIMNASVTQFNSFRYDLAVNQNSNRIYAMTDHGAITLDGLTNNILYTNFVSTEESIGGAVIDKLTDKLYLRGQTGIFIVSDNGSRVPEFESITIAIVASAIGMVIASQKYKKSWSIS